MSGRRSDGGWIGRLASGVSSLTMSVDGLVDFIESLGDDLAAQDGLPWLWSPGLSD